ncbi:rifin [Plasmodium reichenowi]|uniref:Rifin n=1 Tax=Plasmodium reichenowi TaxID=5854 RepID=A0A060RQJ7_PLARE|nr:rifin [Plasmodium reichenowi]
MKVHYFNILLFALPLNILVYNQRNHYITPYHTAKIPTTRLLCECELYAPANYDNDAQMKEVMQQFEDRTSQRFHEYDDRMVGKRKQCKDKCDKEIQKIILKDKLEKQIAQQLNTLETKIDTDDIPTCICEKSLADKMEKFCLNCGMNVGGGVIPAFGAIGGTASYTLNLLKPAALKAAKAAALTEAKDLATQEGMEAVILKIQELSSYFIGEPGFFDLRPIVTPSTYDKGPALVEAAKKVIGEACRNERGNLTSFYNTAIRNPSNYNVGSFGEVGRSAFETEFASQKGALETANLATVEATYASYQTAIIASIVAIVVIVFIMVIIYLILRYRRKKKMKKKLQYIKLLEE